MTWPMTILDVLDKVCLHSMHDHYYVSSERRSRFITLVNALLICYDQLSDNDQSD